MDKSDELIDECKYEGVKIILENLLDEKIMEKVLDCYFKDIDILINCKEIKIFELNLLK